MKNRTVSHRNVCGAFIGGILGILALGYFHPIGLPIGCLLGVIVGYWYDVIGQETGKQYRKTLSFVQRVGQAILTPPKVFKNWLAHWEFKWNDLGIFTPVIRLGRPIVRAAQATVYGVVWSFGRPQALVVWCRKHKANKMIVLDISVIIGLTIATIALYIPLILWTGHKAGTAAKGSLNELWVLVCFAFLMATICGVMVSVIIPTGLYGRETGLSAKYARYEGYSQNGPLTHSLKTALKLACVQLSILLYTTSVVVLGIPGIILSAIAVFTIFFAIGFIRGLYKATVSRGYGLCFAVTLFVTAVTGLLSYVLMSNHLLIWLVALTNGTICGLVVEPARQGLARFMENNRIVLRILTEKEYDDPITVYGRWLKPVWGTIESVSNRLVPMLAG